MADIIIDVIIAFFASIGFLFVCWHIICRAEKSRGCALICLPEIEDDGFDEDIADFRGADCFVFYKTKLDKKALEDCALQGLGEKTKAVWIGKRCEGTLYLRGDD